MPHERQIQANQTPSPIYEIRVEGHLSDQWVTWFEGMTLTHEDNGHTVLTGSVVDQAALHGLLRRVRDLGIPLVSVIRLTPNTIIR